MTYSVKQYAIALLQAFEASPEEKEKAVVKHFFRLLRKKGDLRRLTRILEELRRVYFKRENIRHVYVESFGGLSDGVKKEIERALGKKVYFEELVQPNILAGIRLIVDDEILIDATGRTQIERLFPRR